MNLHQRKAQCWDRQGKLLKELTCLGAHACAYMIDKLSDTGLCSIVKIAAWLMEIRKFRKWSSIIFYNNYCWNLFQNIFIKTISIDTLRNIYVLE